MTITVVDVSVVAWVRRAFAVVVGLTGVACLAQLLVLALQGRDQMAHVVGIAAGSIMPIGVDWAWIRSIERGVMPGDSKP